MDTDRLTRTVASNVKDAMDAAGENLLSMERKTGISRSTLRRRLTGNSPWTTPEMAAIADCFGTQPHELFKAVA